MKVVRGDVRDQALLERVLGEYEIDTVFHLAAQTIVGIANRNPVSTFETNIARHLGAARGLPAQPDGQADRGGLVRQGVRRPATSCPTPRTRRSQGRHPYDVSKSCADLIAQSLRRRPTACRSAITRCGNFYGGGDLNWNRIVPGTIRSVLRGERPVDPLRRHSSSATTSTSRTAPRPTCCWPRRWRPTRRCAARPSTSRNESRVTVLELVARDPAGVMGTDLEPDVRNEASNEIRDQYLDATKARARAGLGADCSPSTRACAEPSPGTAAFLGAADDHRAAVAAARAARPA